MSSLVVMASVMRQYICFTKEYSYCSAEEALSVNHSHFVDVE